MERIKYLGVNLPKEVKDLYLQNYTTLMKEVKDDINRASLVAQWLKICLPMQGHGFEPWSGKIPYAAERLGP